MRKSSMILLTTFFTSIFLVGGALIHEQTHVEIAEMYGCNAEIHPYPDNQSFMHVKYACPYEDKKQVKEMQNVVEAAGYQIVPIYMVLGFMLAMQIVVLALVLETRNRYPY